MRKPGTDESNVQMSDVLCDFCLAEWTEDRPLIEGHQGSVICGACLTLAYRAVVNGEGDAVTEDYECVMCREDDDDRVELNRADEPGWSCPRDPEVAICRRCIKLGAGAMDKDPDINWRRPARA